MTHTYVEYINLRTDCTSIGRRAKKILKKKSLQTTQDNVTCFLSLHSTLIVFLECIFKQQFIKNIKNYNKFTERNKSWYKFVQL